jgi:hypothetical protein
MWSPTDKIFSTDDFSNYWPKEFKKFKRADFKRLGIFTINTDFKILGIFTSNFGKEEDVRAWDDCGYDEDD